MPRYQHIVAAVDFSPLSAAVIKQAQQLAETYNARLSLVHVVQDMPIATEPFGEPAGLVLSQELLQHHRDKAQHDLDALATRFALPLNVERAVVEGIDPADSILEFAQSKHTDLIVLAHSGKRGFFGLLGSTATAVVKGAHCDVLVLREDSEDKLL